MSFSMFCLVQRISPIQNIEMEITICNCVVKSKDNFASSMSKHFDIRFMGAESFRSNLDGNSKMTFPVIVAIYFTSVYNFQFVKLTAYQSDGIDTSSFFLCNGLSN